MSEREPTGETQQQQRPQQRNANINVHRRGGPPKKPGKDRRMSLRTKQFDDNMHRKMDGEEVPKTLKVSEAYLRSPQLQSAYDEASMRHAGYSVWRLEPSYKMC